MKKTLAAAVGVALVAIAAAWGADIRRSPEAVADEYLVVLRDDAVRDPGQGPTAGPTVAEIASEVALAYNARVVLTYEHPLKGFVIKIPKEQVTSLARDRRVAYIEQNGRVRLSGAQQDASAKAGVISAEAKQNNPNLKNLRHFPEGGIIEHIFFRNPPQFHDLSKVQALPVAYLMSHTADPEKFPFRVGECATQEDGVSPFSQSRERTYIDAGDLTFKGGPEDLIVPPERNVHDREGRDHDIAYHEHIEDSGERFLAPGTEYEIHLAGSEEFPETTYERGEAVYLPLPSEEIEPGWPVDVIEIPRGQDFVWKWDPPDKPKKPGLHHYHWIGFAPLGAVTAPLDRTGISMAGLTHWCLHEDTGEYVISKETIDELAEVQPEGFAIYGTGAVRFGELKGGDIEGRRLDFYGYYLYSAFYRVVD